MLPAKAGPLAAASHSSGPAPRGDGKSRTGPAAEKPVATERA